ncbi:MAG: DUF4157 domain-containing protein [Nitrospirales bacterium]|nr:DUF4157 domain-containing protein [Nitrospirales bacterium]
MQRTALSSNEGGSRGAGDVPPIVHDVLRSPGQPLDVPIRAFFEPHFGHDFSQVRVHTDARAVESARMVDALAYTVGRNVVFGAGQYVPGTNAGQKLLAHELTHVVQQSNVSPSGQLHLDSPTEDSHESAAQQEETLVGRDSLISNLSSRNTAPSSGLIQRRIVRDHVSCRQNGLTNPNLTGDEVIAALEAADSEAITLALRAELLLDFHLLFARAGEPVDPAFDTILQEELGLTLTNPAHFRLIEQQRERFKRVRETLESGYLRYICRGSTTTPISIIGCAPAPCGNELASSCPGNRLVVLCQAFWDDPSEQAGTILHEPFHIWFDMARHNPGALRRADATCFETFARRLAGEDVSHISCAGHTAG